VSRAAALVLIVGFACLIVALAAVDWRLGLALLGVGLMTSVIDQPRVRR